jgi:uncharacterized RDD family membrane protein YckC
MEKAYVKAGYARVVLAGLIDAALVIVLFVGIVNSLGPGFLLFWPNFSVLGCLVLYRLFTIINNGHTLGMQVLGLTFLNGEEEPLNLSEKLLAAVFVLYQGVGYYRATRLYA